MTQAVTKTLCSLREIAEGVYAHEDLFPLYALSYYHYTVLGTFIGVVVGVLVSWMSSTSDDELQKLHPDLITPVMRRYLPEKKIICKYYSKPEYREVAQAQEMETVYPPDLLENSKSNDRN